MIPSIIFAIHVDTVRLQMCEQEKEALVEYAEEIDHERENLLNQVTMFAIEASNLIREQERIRKKIRKLKIKIKNR